VAQSKLKPVTFRVPSSEGSSLGGKTAGAWR